jgi:hypothetical protein
MKRALGLGMVMALAACDPLATGSFKPAIATINGIIDGSTAAETPSEVRVALLWQNDLKGNANYAVQLADVLAQFPAAFSIDVTDKPRAEVIDSIDMPLPGIDPAMRWAVATLVVYADDGNGKLDMTAPNEPSSGDRILGATTDLDLFWLLSGRPAPTDLIGIFPVAPGFSFVAEPPQRDPAPGECGRFTAQGHYSDLCGPVQVALPQPLDPQSFVEHLTLADAPRLHGFTCTTFLGPNEYPDYALDPNDVCDGGVCKFCRGYQCPPDLPVAGDAVTCAPDKLSYVYKRCVDDAAWCGTRFCHYGHGERLAADPPPPDWPCP